MFTGLFIWFNTVSAQESYKIDLAKATSDLSKSSVIYSLPNPYREIDPLKRYKKMRAGGIALTAFGTAATIAGGLLIKKDNDLGKANPSRKDASMNYGLGIGLIAVGVPGILSGVPMWIVGDRKLKKVINNVGIKASPASAGLVYKF